MIKILFVCYGNICRSPMAEFIFKNIVEKKELKQNFYIDSAATSNEEIGNGMYWATKQILDEKQVPYTNHIARQITKKDYKDFDYIIGMEKSNIEDIIRIVGKDNENKVVRLLDFSKAPRDIEDPWFSRNFNKAFLDIFERCNCLLDYLI